MTTLAERAASANGGETRDVILDLHDGLSPIWDDDQACAFVRLLDLSTPESLLAAAIMLIPEDHPKWAVTGRNSATIGRKLSEDVNVNALDWVFAATPALALIAAVAQSKGL